MFVDLLEEESALETHFLDAPVQACDAQARAVVVFFDVVDAPPKIDAFSVVGGFDGGREIFLREGSRGWKYRSARCS